MSQSDRRRNANSAARLAAVQALYEIDVAGADTEEVLKAFKEKRWSSVIAEMARELGDDSDYVLNLPEPERRVLPAVVRGVGAHRAELDEMLAEQMSRGAETFEQLEALTKAILRAAAFEMAHAPQVPAGAITADYVAIANAFFTENQPRLINAVVDGLAKRLRGEAGAAD